MKYYKSFDRLKDEESMLLEEITVYKQNIEYEKSYIKQLSKFLKEVQKDIELYNKIEENKNEN